MAEAPLTYPPLPEPVIEAFNSAKGWTCLHGQRHASSSDLFTVEQMRAYVDADRAARSPSPTQHPAAEGMTIAGDGAAMLGRLMREQRASRLGVYPDGNPNVNVPHAQPPSPPVAAQVEPNLQQIMIVARALHATGPDPEEWDSLLQCEVDVLRQRAEQILGMLVNAAPQPPRPGTAPLSDDLLQRCQELLAWHKTGRLEGDALRNYASELDCPDYLRLRLAESHTAGEAFEFVVAHGIGPTTPTKD